MSNIEINSFFSFDILNSLFDIRYFIFIFHFPNGGYALRLFEIRFAFFFLRADAFAGVFAHEDRRADRRLDVKRLLE